MKPSFSVLSALTMLPVSLFAQGSLTPPAGPAPTMKRLDQIEPRTIINATNTPGIGNNMFVISSSGSYYLTGKITGVSGKNGILINAVNVTIDLNGFPLTGVPGSLAGIWDGGSNHGNATIRNGTVLFWGGTGIDMGVSLNSLVENLTVTNNGGAGLSMYNGCVVRDCISRTNSGDGISTGPYANVTHCIAVDSANGYGFNLGEHSLVSDCVATTNKAYGISTGDNSMVSRCTTTQNFGGGISVGTGSTVASCTASANSSGNGSGRGITTSNGCTVTDSTASYNTVQYGIVTGLASTIRNCTASGNTSSQTTSAGILSAGSTVIGCTANDNTNTNALTHTTGMGIYVNGSNSSIRSCHTDGNKADGISVGSNSLVADNECSNNGLNGILANGGLSRIEGNQANFNTAYGIQVSTTETVLRNSAANNNTNYFPTSGDNFAPIQTASMATNPFANF